MMSSNIHTLLICDVTSGMLGKKVVPREVKKRLPLIEVLKSEYDEYENNYVLVTYNSEFKRISIQGYCNYDQSKELTSKVSFKHDMLGSNIRSHSYIANWLIKVDPTLLEKPVTEPNPETESYNVF